MVVYFQYIKLLPSQPRPQGRLLGDHLQQQALMSAKPSPPAPNGPQNAAARGAQNAAIRGDNVIVVQPRNRNNRICYCIFAVLLIGMIRLIIVLAIT